MILGIWYIKNRNQSSLARFLGSCSAYSLRSGTCEILFLPFLRVGVTGLPLGLRSRFSLLPLRVRLIITLLKLSDCRRMIREGLLPLSRPERQEQWEQSDWVCQDWRQCRSFSYTFYSSITGCSVSSFSFFQTARVSWLGRFLESGVCSSINFYNFSLDMMFFSLTISQKESIRSSGAPHCSFSLHRFQLTFKRLSSSSMPCSSLIFLMTFLCLKMVSPLRLSRVQMQSSSSLSFTSRCTILPKLMRMYLNSFWKYILSTFMLQLVLIFLSSVAHLLRQLQSASMLVFGGKSRSTSGASLRHFISILLRDGQKSTIERHLEANASGLHGGCTNTTSTLRLSTEMNSCSLISMLHSTSYTFALLSRQLSFLPLKSLAINLTQEFTLASFIAVPPTPANPSRITFAPVHLLATNSETCSGGVLLHDPSSSLTPSSNLQKIIYLWFQKRSNSGRLKGASFSFLRLGELVREFLRLERLGLSSIRWILTSRWLSLMPIATNSSSAQLQIEQLKATPSLRLDWSSSSMSTVSLSSPFDFLDFFSSSPSFLPSPIAISMLVLRQLVCLPLVDCWVFAMLQPYMLLESCFSMVFEVAVVSLFLEKSALAARQGQTSPLSLPQKDSVCSMDPRVSVILSFWSCISLQSNKCSQLLPFVRLRSASHTITRNGSGLQI